MADKHFTRLLSSGSGFNQMIQRFGVVTVMNARVYEWFDWDEAGVLPPVDAPASGGNEAHPTPVEGEDLPTASGLTPYQLYKEITGEEGLTPLCTLDTLKISNISMDGPSKTISGGQYANPIIKFGKSARLEMQDALGHIDAIDALCGGVAERTVSADGECIGLHVGEDFNTPKIIIGDTFFIDQATQQQVPVVIMFYKFLPDSLFNLTQDAEGDASIFDMNGDLLPVSVLLGNDKSELAPHDVFYSIIDPAHDDQE